MYIKDSSATQTSSQEIIASLVENPYSIPDELIIASIGRLIEADVNSLEEYLAPVLQRTGLSRTSGHFLLDTFVRSWVQEVLHGHIVEAHDLTQFTRQARENAKNEGYFKRLGVAISGRSFASETKLIEAAEQTAAEVKIAKKELQDLLFKIAKVEKEFAEIPEKSRSSALKERQSLEDGIYILELRKAALELEIAQLRAKRSEILEKTPEAAQALDGVLKAGKTKMFFDNIELEYQAWTRDMEGKIKNVKTHFSHSKFGPKLLVTYEEVY